MEDITLSKSKFTGHFPEVFIVNLITVFLSFIGIFTFGILSAFATIYKQRWVARHTFIDGKQLRFNANFIDLWVRTLVWILLTFVTIGFYAILGFLFCAQQRYFVAHTHFAEESVAN